MRNRLERARRNWQLDLVELKLKIAGLDEESARVRKVLWQYYIRSSSPVSSTIWILPAAFVFAVALCTPPLVSAYLFTGSWDIGALNLTGAYIVYIFSLTTLVWAVVSLATDELRSFWTSLSAIIVAMAIIACFIGGNAIAPKSVPVGLLSIPILIGIAIITIAIESLVGYALSFSVRRQIDYLPTSSLAIHDLIEVLDIIAPRKKAFLRSRSRRYALRKLARIRSLIASRATARHIPLSRGSYSFEIVQDRFLRCLALVEESSAAILMSRNAEENEASIHRVREAIYSLLDDDWSTFPEPAKISTFSIVRVFVRRLLTPAFLVAVAFGLQHASFIELSDATRTTIQVALIVSALLALAPVDGEAKKQVLAIFQSPPKA